MMSINKIITWGFKKSYFKPYNEFLDLFLQKKTIHQLCWGGGVLTGLQTYISHKQQLEHFQWDQI